MGMIILVIALIILFIILACVFAYMCEETDYLSFGLLACVMIGLSIATPFLVGNFHGYVNYIESNDKDKARITAITQEQDLMHAYYKIDVEYLTNTPTQQGMITNYRIEKDTFYCYITDKELVDQVKNNMYKEVWIYSGYKGGYETYKDFGTKLLKRIEIIEE